MKDILIVLPTKIPIFRSVEPWEFNIYFENIILPYRREWDVQVRCKYGRNFGRFWRLCECPQDVNSFDFEIVIYNEYGEKIASKSTVMELFDSSASDAPYNIIFLGDSMTYHRHYLNHIVNTLHSIVTKGSRRFEGDIACEGRGGWRYDDYIYQDRDCHGTSPFVFPKGVDNYLGDIDFINKVNALNEELEYDYAGFERHTFVQGATYSKAGALYSYESGEFKPLMVEPDWEFDFEKYVKRYNLGKLDAVSILLGANDLCKVTYEQSESKIAEYVKNAELVIDAIHKYDKTIKILINLPVIGAEQYAWSGYNGCALYSKMYRYNVIHAAKAILEKWSDCEKDGIYVGPMLLAIDPMNGFPVEQYKSGLHSEAVEQRHSDAVHPSLSGYCQMGDAVCGVIQKMRYE